ncbi:serine hydrolase [Paenibacillus sp. FSL R5-0407]|uniref:serine hydrolase domain-containing protein n=1 Tax=Paenibacillus sp. FSL R5-0407 TaxID=2975320 RepID=UPI0030FBD8A5
MNSAIADNAFLPADKAICKSYPGIRSFLVAQEGTIRFENYYNGYHSLTLHDLRSATKSVISLLLGIAEAQGRLPGLDRPVWDSVKEHAPQRPDPKWAELTLRELLTMTTGLYWQTGPRLGERFIRRFHQSRRWADFILRLPVVPERRGTFQYCSAGSHLLSILLTKWTGFSALEYASRYLFRPLEISRVAWGSSPEGHSSGHIGLHMTARDMLKIGLLCLGKGTWEGRSLLSAHWLDESMAPHCTPFNNYGRYGFHWWSAESGGTQYSYAHGHGGQQIYVISELEAVVVFTSESRVNRFKNPKGLLEKFILPALQKT